jgi:hypothetical protein
MLPENPVRAFTPGLPQITGTLHGSVAKVLIFVGVIGVVDRFVPEEDG